MYCTYSIASTFWKIVIKELPYAKKSRIVCMNFHMIPQNQRDLFEPQKSKLKLPKYNWSLNDR